MKKGLFILLTLISVWSCEKRQVKKEYLVDEFQYKSISGVKSKYLSLDLYTKSDGLTNKPVIIWVHGGAWAIGDKENKITDKTKLFCEAGYVFVSLNYRLSPKKYDPDNTERIMFPTHNQDVADGISWVYQQVESYGGNPNKIGIIGHSAGGHLVSLTAVNSSYLSNANVPFSAIKAVASIDAGGYNVYEQVRNGSNPDMYINAFGSDSASNCQASPVYQFKPNVTYPAFFIAKRGQGTHLENTLQFIDSLNNYQVNTTVIDGSSYSHSEINEAIGKDGESLITNPLMTFFETSFQ